MSNVQKIKTEIITKREFNLFEVPILQAVAGDRKLLPAEKKLLKKALEARGDNIYSDFLYTLTHHSFKPAAAKKHWEGILRHKDFMEEKLDRKVGLIVALTDYFTNIKKLFTEVTIVPEMKMNTMIDIALKDNLTGLYDNYTFRNKLKIEYLRSVRYRSSLTLVLIDIDNFKWVNDTFGHPAGDRVLKKTAELLLRLDFPDSVFRIGGDEFALLYAAPLLPEHITAMQKLTRPFTKKFHKMSFSIGVASSSIPGVESAESMYKLADKALYRSKKSGKNRLVFYNGRTMETASPGSTR
jgi:diguanylate cyclase (GGDEF)-like protein